MTWLRLVLGVLLLANIATAVAIAHTHHRHRQVFVELSREEKIEDALEIEFSQLQLEYSVYAKSALIDQIAHEKLGMVRPEAKEIVVVRR